MKKTHIIIIGIFLLTWNFTSSQTISEYTFEKHKMIVSVDGNLKSNTGIGTDCKMRYNSKTGIYNMEYKDSNGSIVFQIFKVVERNENDIIVQFLGDDSPVIVKYKVKDKISADNFIEFESTKSPDSERNVQIIFRYENDSD